MTAKTVSTPLLTRDQPTSWSIAQVEKETGLGKDTLRVWERRYGFPQPGRDAQDERAYPDDQLVRLRLIKRLLDAGYRPGKVVTLPADRLQAMLEEVTGDEARSAGDKSGPNLAHTAVWMEWLAQDKPALIKQSLQQHILRHGLGSVVEELVAPLCGMVGMAWMRGEITVYQEHLFTETLQAVLREAIAAVDARGQRPSQRPRVLLTTTPQEMHGLGLLMVECQLALASCERLMLGTSMPLSEMVLAARQLDVDVLALSFSAYATRKDMLDSLKPLLEQLPKHIEVWVGGAGANTHARALPRQVQLMRKASDVPTGVRAWRLRHGMPPEPEAL